MWETIANAANFITICVGVGGIIVYFVRKKNSDKLMVFSNIFNAFIQCEEELGLFRGKRILYISPEVFSEAFSNYIKESKIGLYWHTKNGIQKINDEGAEVVESEDRYFTPSTGTQEELEDWKQVKEKLKNDRIARYSKYMKLSEKDREEYVYSFISSGFERLSEYPARKDFTDLEGYLKQVYLVLTKNGYQYNKYFHECMTIINKLYISVEEVIDNYDMLIKSACADVYDDINKEQIIREVEDYVLGYARDLDADRMYMILQELELFIKKYSKEAEKIMLTAKYTLQ